MEPPAKTGRELAKSPATITFKGDGVDGEIEVSKLAKTLKGLADLTSEVAKLDEFKNLPSPEVSVVATRKGSFEIQILFQAFGELWNATRQALTSSDAEAVANIVALSTATFELIRFLKEKGSRRIERNWPKDNERVEVELEDGEKLETSHEVFKVAQSRRACEAARNAVSPATTSGITEINFYGSVNNVNLTVTSEEAAAITIEDPLDEEVLNKVTKRARFTRLDFVENKWRVEIDGDAFAATIEDEDFLHKVDTGAIEFGKYTDFEITYQEKKKISSGKTTIERTVLKVRKCGNAEYSQDALPPNRDQNPG